MNFHTMESTSIYFEFKASNEPPTAIPCSIYMSVIDDYIKLGGAFGISISAFQKYIESHQMNEQQILQLAQTAYQDSTHELHPYSFFIIFAELREYSLQEVNSIMDMEETHTLEEIHAYKRQLMDLLPFPFFEIIQEQVALRNRQRSTARAKRGKNFITETVRNLLKRNPRIKNKELFSLLTERSDIEIDYENQEYIHIQSGDSATFASVRAIASKERKESIKPAKTKK